MTPMAAFFDCVSLAPLLCGQPAPPFCACLCTVY